MRFSAWNKLRLICKLQSALKNDIDSKRHSSYLILEKDLPHSIPHYTFQLNQPSLNTT